MVTVSMTLFVVVVLLCMALSLWLTWLMNSARYANKGRTIFFEKLKQFTRVHIERGGDCGDRFRVSLFGLIQLSEGYHREIIVASTAWHDTLEEAFITAFLAADERERDAEKED